MGCTLACAWRIRLHRPCAAAMRPCGQVILSSTAARITAKKFYDAMIISYGWSLSSSLRGPSRSSSENVKSMISDDFLSTRMATTGSSVTDASSCTLTCKPSWVDRSTRLDLDDDLERSPSTSASFASATDISC